MFLHLGDDVLVYTQNIIVILNAQILNKNKINQEEVLPKFPEKKIKITPAVKSYIITDKCIYFSPISAATLKKRVKFLKNIPNFWDT